MSAEDDEPARPERLDPDRRRALLDDLESIRTLLEEDGAAPDEIPVLREVVRPAGGDATAAAPPVPDAASAPRQETQGDLFDPRAFADRLLDGEWAEERERILDDARAGVTAFSLGLDEQERAAREARLRAAVEARLAPRMEQLIGEALDELQANMLRVVRRELSAIVAACFADEPPGDGSQDE